MLEYIQDNMPPESAVAFGLHPNAEIGFKLREAESFCGALLSMQPREAGGEGVASVEERAKAVLVGGGRGLLGRLPVLHAPSLLWPRCMCMEEAQGKSRRQLERALPAPATPAGRGDGEAARGV